MWNEQLFKERQDKDCDYSASSTLFTAGADAQVRSASLSLRRKCFNKYTPLYFTLSNWLNLELKQYFFYFFLNNEFTLVQRSTGLLLVVVFASLQQSDTFGMKLSPVSSEAWTDEWIYALCSQNQICFGFRLNKSKLMAVACRATCLMWILLTVIDSSSLCLGVWWCQSVCVCEGAAAQGLFIGLRYNSLTLLRCETTAGIWGSHCPVCSHRHGIKFAPLAKQTNGR